ncbi:hypothetical protein N7508_004567 [Penicillium antarcticum]|uniref:uncharacterized protein n=1 Tax=Penicillium antarcticum TaxID=416450 RepID=UPI0023990477|nr:uncharacterized protein N7508_004567 [Penicillium antarcticum]KAJ5309188.1 hypothetical protein N7508_004567 [Penicillium antarcticum]
MGSSESDRLIFQETDEAGNSTATYIYSGDGASRRTSSGRVDVMTSPSSTSLWSTKPLVSSLSDVFLPSGYPHSVSDDYLPYQVFDSLQAFCSSIAGLLSSRAVLQGVGVGNADASPTSALLLHILQDISGRIATILFAHRVGTALEPECKTYRLAADVFNDIAMIMDCLSPMVPAGMMRVTVLSTAGVLRALCGVAGGSSKASLSAHFARWGNLAELNAKDSSQETVISLFGMLVGSVVISHINSFTTTWIALLLLLALHLSMNYAAVRAVQMTSLNRQRANITFSALLDSDASLANKLSLNSMSASAVTSKLTIFTPADVAYHERIFHRDGALRWTSHSSTSTSTSTEHLGSAQIGLALSSFFGTSTNGIKTTMPVNQLTSLFSKESYLLYLTPSSQSQAPKRTWNASILLKRNCSIIDQLKAWTHALLAARILMQMDSSKQSQAEIERGRSKERGRINRGRKDSSPGDAADLSGSGPTLDVLERTLSCLNAESRFEGYLVRLRDAGWNLDIAALETRGGRRVSV